MARNQAKFATMLRVDQAGEYGATRIYAGQLAVMGDRAPAYPLLFGAISLGCRAAIRLSEKF